MQFREMEEEQLHQIRGESSAMDQSGVAENVTSASRLVFATRPGTEVIDVEHMSGEEIDGGTPSLGQLGLGLEEGLGSQYGDVYPSPTEVATQASFDVWEVIGDRPGPEPAVSRLEIARGSSAAAVGDNAVQACRASIAPSVPQFFWETDPFLKMVFGSSSAAKSDIPLPTAGLKRPLPPIEVHASEEEWPIDKSLKAGAAQPQPLHSRALRAISTEDIVSRRAAVVSEWAAMVALNINAFSIGKMLDADKKAVVHQDIVDSVTACFAAKATSTLVKRMCAMSLFCKWCLANGMELFPAKERVMFNYLNSIRDGPNPFHTRGRSFLEAIHFTTALLGMQNDLEAVGAQRLEGVAEAMAREGPPVSRARPLTVPQVKMLERLVVETENLQDKVMVGNLLVLLYSCARHSDGLRAQELIVDVPDEHEVNPRSVENQGFLELSVLAHKGAYTTVMKRTLLPVVAPMYSLSSANWHQSWLQAREAVGLEKSGRLVFPLLCRFEADGKPSMQPTSSSEVGSLLRLALGTKDPTIRSHSLKVTALSWCSKGGITLEERKVLGHHMDKAHRSAFTYGRDNAAPALRSLCNLLKLIKQGDFRPDSTRSGRFREQAAALQVAREKVVHQEVETPEESGPPTVIESAADDADSSSLDSWTDSASDADEGEDQDETDLENVDNTVLLNLVMPNLKPARFDLYDDMRSWKHRQSGIQHIQEEDSSKFLCGRRVTDRYFLCNSPPAIHEPVCQVCLGSSKVRQG